MRERTDKSASVGIARRRAEEKRDEAFFLGERRRRRRGRARCASGQTSLRASVSRAAVLRRSETRRFSSVSADEGGGVERDARADRQVCERRYRAPPC